MTKYSFYRPHDRVQFDNFVTDPVTGEVTYPPSMTKQEFVAECDINNIIKAFSVSGMLTHISANAAMGTYEDLPDTCDFQDALHTIQAAEAAFMSLPSKTRDRFQNDPAQFLDFMGNPNNADEMLSLGLRIPPPPNRGGDGGDPPPVVGSESPTTDRTP